MAYGPIYEAGEAEAVTAQMAKAIDALPPAVAAAERIKHSRMLSENVSRLFFIELELSGAGPTYDIKAAHLKPSRFYLDALAAVRAGKLDWDIEQPDSLGLSSGHDDPSCSGPDHG